MVGLVVLEQSTPPLGVRAEQAPLFMMEARVTVAYIGLWAVVVARRDRTVRVQRVELEEVAERGVEEAVEVVVARLAPITQVQMEALAEQTIQPLYWAGQEEQYQARRCPGAEIAMELLVEEAVVVEAVLI
jgi:hypothetical protein